MRFPENTRYPRIHKILTQWYIFRKYYTPDGLKTFSYVMDKKSTHVHVSAGPWRFRFHDNFVSSWNWGPFTCVRLMTDAKVDQVIEALVTMLWIWNEAYVRWSSYQSPRLQCLKLQCWCFLFDCGFPLHLFQAGHSKVEVFPEPGRSRWLWCWWQIWLIKIMYCHKYLNLIDRLEFTNSIRRIKGQYNSSNV